jgi:hypothetical protein
MEGGEKNPNDETRIPESNPNAQMTKCGAPMAAEVERRCGHSPSTLHCLLLHFLAQRGDWDFGLRIWRSLRPSVPSSACSSASRFDRAELWPLKWPPRFVPPCLRASVPPCLRAFVPPCLIPPFPPFAFIVAIR